MGNDLKSKHLVDDTRNIQGTQFELDQNKTYTAKLKSETLKLEGYEGTD